MFENPSPSLNMRAIFRDMLADEHELLTALGQDFLAEHLEGVDRRIARWERYMGNHYADGTPAPRGDADKLRTYQLERALIVQLADAARTEAFPVVHQRALRQARQQVRLLANKRDFKNPSLKTARYKARLEQELLVELWAKWRAWLRPPHLLRETHDSEASQGNPTKVEDTFTNL